MGTPSDNTWKDCEKLPDFKLTFPRWQKQPLNKICNNLDGKIYFILENGIDLLQKLL